MSEKEIEEGVEKDDDIGGDCEKMGGEDSNSTDTASGNTSKKEVDEQSVGKGKEGKRATAAGKNAMSPRPPVPCLPPAGTPEDIKAMSPLSTPPTSPLVLRRALMASPPPPPLSPSSPKAAPQGSATPLSASAMKSSPPSPTASPSRDKDGDDVSAFPGIAFHFEKSSTSAELREQSPLKKKVEMTRPFLYFHNRTKNRGNIVLPYDISESMLLMNVPYCCRYLAQPHE